MLPEIETKISLKNDVNSLHFCKKLLKWVDAYDSKLLPYPHMMNRIRKCHILDSKDQDLKEFQLTLMETASGKIALKKKKHPRIKGVSYIRNTTASLKTDIKDNSVDVVDFIE